MRYIEIPRDVTLDRGYRWPMVDPDGGPMILFR